VKIELFCEFIHSQRLQATRSVFEEGALAAEDRLRDAQEGLFSLMYSVNEGASITNALAEIARELPLRVFEHGSILAFDRDSRERVTLEVDLP
jgi:hypothetical protein